LLLNKELFVCELGIFILVHGFGCELFYEYRELNYVDEGTIFNWAPITLNTFIIVSNCGFAPSDNALYKLGLLIPASFAILDIPIALATCSTAIIKSASFPSSKMAFKYSAIISLLSR